MNGVTSTSEIYTGLGGPGVTNLLGPDNLGSDGKVDILVLQSLSNPHNTMFSILINGEKPNIPAGFKFRILRMSPEEVIQLSKIADLGKLSEKIGEIFNSTKTSQ